MDLLQNENLDYSNEDIRYFVDRYLQGIKLNDVSQLKLDVFMDPNYHSKK